MEIETTIFTQPVAKGRPRMAVVAGHATAYTPKKTRISETEIKILIRQEVMKLGSFRPGVPLYLQAIFFIEKPKSKPKKITIPVTRPDLDNYTKTLMDALNGYVIPDDSQVVTMNISKRYKSPACIYLRIREELQ